MGKQRTIKFQLDRDNRDSKCRYRNERRQNNLRNLWKLDKYNGCEDVPESNQEENDF